jgi:pimeloyl-ACP methyl ester carboxylesterase
VPRSRGGAYNTRVTAVSDSLASAAPLEEVPLPWRWFEFRQSPRSPNLPLPADPHAVYAIEVDSHVIPFKFLRRPSGGAPPRPVLMLLHGMGLTIASFRGIASHLLATHDLLCPDYSGFSQDSAPLPDHASFKAFVVSIWRLADALGIDRLSLAGNSLGGGLALMATLLAPQRADRIVLSNPACFPQPLPSMYRMARVPLWGELMMLLASPEKFMAGLEYIGYVDKTRFDPALRALYAASLASRRNRLRLMQLIRQLPANAADLTGAAYLARLSLLRQPVLVSWGVQDPLLAEGAGERLAAALPNATYDPHPDLSHMCHEEAPDRIGRRWAEFLNEPLHS